MGEIKAPTSINPTVGINEHRQTLRRNLKAAQKEERISEENLHAKTEDENLFREITAKQYFTQAVDKNTTHQTRESIPPNMLGLYESEFSDANLSNNTLELTYLSGEEIEEFVNLLDKTGKKKEKFAELAELIVLCGEGEEERIIDQAARTVCANNKAEIYLMLCYLYEDLLRQKAKKELGEKLRKLRRIIEALERQESAYLFSFFSFENLLKSSTDGTMNSQTMNLMAGVSAGSVRLNSLRQTLQFVGQILPDEQMEKMVSIFMKFQAKNIKRISSLSEGRESKEELATILQQERNLIILNSLYNYSKALFKQLQKKTKIEEKYAKFIDQTITILETSLVNLNTFETLEKIINMKDTDDKIKQIFIKGFLMLVNKMPNQIFMSEVLKDKLINNLKQLLGRIDDSLNNQANELSFLRKKIFKKNTV